MNHIDLEFALGVGDIEIEGDVGASDRRRSSLAFAGSSVKICARAATFGVAVETGGGGGSGASRRWQCHPLDRIRVRTVGLWRR